MAFFSRWWAKVPGIFRENQELTRVLGQSRIIEKKQETEIIGLHEEIRKLKTQVAILEDKQSDPVAVVEAVMNKKVKYFDMTKLTLAEQTQYFSEAQSALRNPVLENEKNYLIELFSRWALEEAPDFSGVRDMRMTINGIEMFWKRLREIPDPIVKHTEDDVYDGL